MSARPVIDLPSIASAPLVTLSAADIRQRMDGAVRRAWMDIARRAARVALLAGTDLLAALVALGATLLLLERSGVSASLSWALAWPLAVLVVLVQPLVLTALGAYRVVQSRAGFGRVLGAVLGVAFLGWAHARLLEGGPVELLTGAGLALYVICASLLIFGGRVAVDRVLAFAYRRGWGQRQVLVVGSARETARLMRLLGGGQAAEVRMVGRVPLRNGNGRGNPGAEAVPDLEPALRESGASEVIIASSGLSFEDFETLVQRCFESGVVVSIAPSTLHRINPRIELNRTRVGTVLRLRPGGLGLPKLAVKRAMDILLSVSGLVLLAPVLVLIAIAIRLDSAGPVVFRQRRTGLAGRPFWMYKFRTMVANADEVKPQLLHLNESGDPRLFKIRDDPRITRVGQFLRRTSLDELPQLVNVLRGEMSVIGPRPFFPEDLADYAAHHFERLRVLPGITGLWQVSGRSAVLDFEEVIRFDRQYIHNWSVRMDLRILALTIPAVLRRKGAY